MAFFRLCILTSLLQLLLFSACNPVEPGSGMTPLPVSSPTINISSPIPSQTMTNAPSTDASIFYGPLSVVIRHPADNATVYETPVIVSGNANPGTVISLNEEVILVDESGNFQSPISLEPGMNMIEITASDFQNHQDFSYMTVFFETEP